MAETNYCEPLDCYITEYKKGGFDIAKFWGKTCTTCYEVYLPHGGNRVYCCDRYEQVLQYIRDHKADLKNA